MKKSLVIFGLFAFAFIACGPAHQAAKFAPPSSHCADLTAGAWAQGPIAGVALCLDPAAAKNMSVKTDDDFFSWLVNGVMGGQFPLYVMDYGCGGYSPAELDKYYSALGKQKVTVFEDDKKVVWVYAYAVHIDPALAQAVNGPLPEHSVIAIGVGADGKARLLADVANSSVACPAGHTRVASSSR